MQEHYLGSDGRQNLNVDVAFLVPSSWSQVRYFCHQTPRRGLLNSSSSWILAMWYVWCQALWLNVRCSKLIFRTASTS